MTKSTLKISFLVPDIHSPVLGPVTVLAQQAAARFEVEIVGPDFGHGVCPMYKDSFEYKVVSTPRMYRFPDYFPESRRLADALSGDVIVAVKAFADTVPVALRVKRKRGAKVIVYLDEWDGALMARRTAGQRLKRWLYHAHHPMDDVYCPVVERMIPRADQVVSTSTFLQNKFGGEIVHMGVDTEFFKPAPDDQVGALRMRHGLTGKRCIVFGGVVRPHKGIELILDALVSLANPGYRFVIVGPVNEHVRELLATPAYAPYLVALGAQSKAQMPLYLSMADLIVLPLSNDLLAQSQTPCKVFEAMSMGKPIIASSVSDLPQILNGCGRVVPPDDTAALADAIHGMFEKAGGVAMGRAAREKCIRLYSSEVTKRDLARILEQVAA
jgi:glycosyltransferase involved in cell wall biosynthesis